MAPLFKADSLAKPHSDGGGMHSPARAARPRRRSTRLLPLLEGLEDRRMPATLLVTSAGDSGPGTLRDIISQANANGESDEIRFPNGLREIDLTTGQLSIASDIAIIGPVGGITITRSRAARTPAFRILEVTDPTGGQNLKQASVRLENVTISRGIAADGLGGGGILNLGQAVTLVGSTVSGNSSTTLGGGIRTAGGPGSSLTVQASIIRENSAVLDGGGILSNSTLTMAASSVIGNSAGKGGGVEHAGGPATVANSTFSGNSATQRGGAILSLTGDPTQLTVVASTLSGNTAPAGSGGGISGVANLTNTIVALNPGGDLTGGTFLGDSNLIGDASGGLDPSTNLFDFADPLLGPLQDNGGPTPTMALLPGSPAIDAGANLPGLGLDQRFAGRPIGGGFDIGAFESGSDRPSLVVNTAADVVDPTDGVTSLREAIAFANARLGPDAITFDPAVFAQSQTVTLNSDLGQLSIQDDLTITGPAASVTIARSAAPGTPQFRIFDILRIPITDKTFARLATVRLDHLTITGGESPTAQDGGGIRADGNLTVVDCTIRGNSTGQSTRGGGIFTSRRLTIVDSTINDNSSGGGGGGIFADGGITLVNSTITRNTAVGQGGGVFAPGGIIGNCTIVGNQASDGGGLFGSTNLSVNNSIVAGNAGGDLSNVATGRANVIGDSSGGLNPSTNHLNAGNPRLGPLQDNGGATQTMALLLGSPAIDAGDNALAVDSDGNLLPRDQRGAGFPRILNGFVDIGAYEFEAVTTTTTLTTSAPSSTYGRSVTFTATVTAGGIPMTAGTVTFLSGSLILASGVPLDAGGHATFSTSALKVTGSPHTLTAQYTGAPGVVSSGSPAVSQVITPAPLTATVVIPSKTYDGTRGAAIDGVTLDGLLGNDQVGLTGGAATFDTREAGTRKSVTVTGLSLTGADADNYVLHGTATATADIAPLPITGLISAADKVYDGTNGATISGRTLSGVLAGDAVTYAGGAATFADKNVGTGKTVTATGLRLTGADARNYTVNSAATTAASISSRSLTVSAFGQNKIYDGTTVAGVTLSDNRVAGDALAVTFLTALFSDPNAGTGKTVRVIGIKLSGPDAGNYTPNTSATTVADIQKAFQTITWTEPTFIGPGMPLSAAQLNATVKGVAGGTRPGELIYTPGPGIKLPLGVHQPLTVTAAETINYKAASLTVHIDVLTASQQAAELRRQVSLLKPQGTLFSIPGLGSLLTSVLTLNGAPLVDALRVGIFSGMVQTFQRAGVLTAAQADPLLNEANTLIQTLLGTTFNQLFPFPVGGSRTIR